MFTKSRTLRIDRGLYLVETKGGRTYSARCRVEGKWAYVSCETSDYAAAEKFAIRWHRTINSARHPQGETVGEAVAAFLASVRDPRKRQTHTARWETIRVFWAPGMGREPVRVAEVDGPLLVKFVEWRRQRNPRLTASSIRIDLVLIRQVMKYAALRGTISTLPTFPGSHVIGPIVPNVRPWFEKHEYAHLLAVARQRVKDAINPNVRRQRQELLDFIELMTATALRVDECRLLRVRDGRVMMPRSSGRKAGSTFTMVNPDGSRTTAKVVAVAYLQLSVRESKTGPRTTVARTEAVAVWNRLVKGKQPDDRVFAEHHRNGFAELLNAAGLRRNSFGHMRTLKSLRPTALSFWLLDKPGIDLHFLARNAGTSVGMLETHYLARLGITRDSYAGWL